MKAWIYQKPAQVRELGKDKAPLYVGWYEPDGRRKGKWCGTGFLGKKNAKKLKEKIDAELLTGTYQAGQKKPWAEFRQEYEAKVIAGKAPATRECVVKSLDIFERIAKPRLVS